MHRIKIVQADITTLEVDVVVNQRLEAALHRVSRTRKELDMRTVATDTAPEPAGHYSQAVIHDGLIYVSGQLAIDPETGKPRAGTIEEQSRLAISNLAAILEAAGSGLDRVIKTTVYISDIELWGRVNAVYAELFGTHRPARAVVPTRELHFGCLVEIEAIAVVES